MGLFTDVRIERLDSFGQTGDIRVDVVEGNAERWILVSGTAIMRSSPAFADLGYKNLFGMNKQASLKIGYNSPRKAVCH